MIGDYQTPKVRLPGSGGSMEIAAWANRCYIITPHQKRRFPAKVDFHTSIGFLTGGDDRTKTGVRGGGPQAVVTNLGILKPDEGGEMVLAAIHPEISYDQVRENTGWNLRIADDCQVTQPPTAEELTILREKLDPQKIYI